MMLESLDSLFAATVLFVGGHVLLSSLPIRGPLHRALGEQGFQAVYSLAMTGALLWMAAAYANAPIRVLWTAPPELAWGTAGLTALASFLVVAGVTTRSVTMVGGERFATGPQDPAPGIFRVTRHPFLWGVALWALGHLAVNGDAASVLFFGGFVVLSLGGMWHIDQRRQQTLGAAWGPIALTTSVVPFQAILAGRTHFDLKGIGWWRPLVAAALYALLVGLHPWLFGVSALIMP